MLWNLRARLPWAGVVTLYGVVCLILYILMLIGVFFLQLTFNIPESDPESATAGDESNKFQNALWVRWDRALGHVCCLQLGLLLYPVSRNSIWAQALGPRFSFDRIVVAHRVIARLLILTVLVHGLNWIFRWLSIGSFSLVSTLITQNYRFMGSLAAITMVVMGVTALEMVRKAHFEVFYYIHHLFVLVLAFSSVHVYFAVHKGFDAASLRLRVDLWWYFIPALVLYLIDRIWRFFRSRVPCELVQFEPKDELAGVTRLQVERDDGFAVLPCIQGNRVGDRRFSFVPGQYCFVCIPELSRMEWHPFSISSSSVTARKQGYFTFHVLNMGPDTWSGRLYALSRQPPRDHALANPTFVPSSEEDARTIFHLAPSRLFSSQDPVRHTLVGFAGALEMYVDGPYGGIETRLRGRDTLVCVAGGIGITPIMSLLQTIADILRTTSVDEMDMPLEMSPASLHQIVLIWTVRSCRYLRWFSRNLAQLTEHLNATSRHDSIDARNKSPLSFSANLFVTQNSPSSESSPLLGDVPEKESFEDTMHDFEPTFATGRPDVQGLLMSYCSGVDVTHVEVLACGPPGLVDATYSAAKNVRERLNVNVRVTDHGFYL